MPHTESLGELAGLAALGALDGPDRSTFEGHLRETCGACEAGLAAWQAELVLFALSVPEVAPPPELRAGLLALLAGSRHI